MHPQNPYQDRYDFKRLTKQHPELLKHVILNPSGEETIDFNVSSAVYALNKALLLSDFKLTDYELPTGYLIPPVPGRLDYLLHIQEFLSEKLGDAAHSKRHGLDIGTGANGIYCILAAQHLNWSMVGTECDAKAVAIAKANMQLTKTLQDKVELRHQETKGSLFTQIIYPNDRFDFTMCNPRFHTSKEEALKGSLRKLKNLGNYSDRKEYILNFEGQANELWCNGGEALFIKRLIKESVHFKDQVGVFRCLIYKIEHLDKIEKQLKKAKASYQIIPMSQGHKKGRSVFWWFE
jgi:23S rRNA (adenine1618-N6)-methyltransferase